MNASAVCVFGLKAASLLCRVFPPCRCTSWNSVVALKTSKTRAHLKPSHQLHQTEAKTINIYVQHLSSHSFSINVKQSSVLYLALVGPCGLKTYRHVKLQFTAVFAVVHVLSIRQVVGQQSNGRRADDQTHQVEQQSCFYLQGIGSRPFSTAI